PSATGRPPSASTCRCSRRTARSGARGKAGSAAAPTRNRVHHAARLWTYINDMSTVPTVVLTAFGVILVAVALRDVFDTLFHEAGRAAVSTVVMRSIWR